MSRFEKADSLSTLKVFLVEDNEDDEFLTVRALSKCGLKNVTVERDGISALEKLTSSTEFSPDILITDINLPGISGIEFLKTIRRNDFTRNIPAVVLTSSINPSDREACMDLGVIEFIPKPPSLQTINSLIEKICL